MILDHLKNAHLYLGLNPYFKTAFKHLSEVKLADFEKKKLEVDGSDFFLLYFDMEGKGRGGVKLECHQKYLDIHFVFKGSDLMGYKETSLCKDLDTDDIAENDYKLFKDKPVSDILINEGYFAIVFPGDAHAPLMGEGKFLKVVAKIIV
jgi:biofilm protein TabA